jgi:1,4-dihydroxy-2-naphthoate polyprenyltransferase
MLVTGIGANTWVILVLLPFALLLIRNFIRERPSPVFNIYLARTAQLQLAYSVLLCIGLYLN